tara:strand:+ start:852 stop:1481 length:630 start_codon:yes stop_codon:yes gene_type:complete
MATYSSIRYNFNLPQASTTSGTGNALELIKSITCSGESTISFANGSSDVVFDGTYLTYHFKLINLHPSSNTTTYRVNFRDGGSAYDASKQTTFFAANHGEDGSGASVAHSDGQSLANNTGVQGIATSVGADNDENFNGEMWVFNPSHDNFVTHFFGINQINNHSNVSAQEFVGGYCNTTTPIDGVQFSVSTGNFESGTIKLYGIRLTGT